LSKRFEMVESVSDLVEGTIQPAFTEEKDALRVGGVQESLELVSGTNT